MSADDNKIMKRYQGTKVCKLPSMQRVNAGLIKAKNKVIYNNLHNAYLYYAFVVIH